MERIYDILWDGTIFLLGPLDEFERLIVCAVAGVFVGLALRFGVLTALSFPLGVLMMVASLPLIFDRLGFIMWYAGIVAICIYLGSALRLVIVQIRTSKLLSPS
jgi:hypothetical protein